MAVNKVIYGGNTLVDLTGDTVTAADLADGVKATGADGNPIVGLLPKVTIDSSLSASSTNPVQNKVIKAELDKKMAKTDKIYEADLKWGGHNIVDDYSPIDASMVPSLGANRFAFARAEGITVEYSTDAGETWLDYGLSDGKKIELFTFPTVPINIGKAPDNPLTPASMLRVIINPQKIGLYTALNKFIMYITTNGCKNCYCTIDASLKSTPETFKVFADKAHLMGWSGWNVINTERLVTYQNDVNRQYDIIRFTFGCTEVNTNYNGLGVYCIFGFGGVGWGTPSNMAQNGHLYKYNAYQEALFPATIIAPNFKGKVNNKTIEASVPANAKFTDTVYTHPATHPASMITGLSTVATSGSYNDLKDKPDIVKTVNNVAPDSDGNINIAVSGGGGVSTDTANTWTAAQTFGDVVFGGVEKCSWEAFNGNSAKPTRAYVFIMPSAGVFTLDMSELAKQTSDDWSNVVRFKIFINSTSDSYTLKIDGITNLYTNNVSISNKMILDGIIWGGTETTYGYISATSLSINFPGGIS